MTDLPHPELGAAWRAARTVPTAGFLDSARCGVPSDRALAATVAHLNRERLLGGYEAEEEAAAGPLEGLRAGLAALLGAADADVGLAPNGTIAAQLVLFGLRLPAGAPVVVGEAEYASNRRFLDDLAERRGWRVRVVRHGPDGVIDLAGLDREVRAGAELVLLSHVASQHGAVQPARQIGALCREHGTLLVLDVAQSLGQVDCRDAGAHAYVGTGRKWLHGPRGAGFVVAPGAAADPRFDAPRTLQSHDDAGRPTGTGRQFETGEADIAGRVGLAVAVGELHAADPTLVFARTAALGTATRAILDGCGGWRVVEREGFGTGLVTLCHPEGADPARMVQAAARNGVRVSAIPVTRAAGMDRPLLRVSPPPGAELADLERLAATLRGGRGPIPAASGSGR